MESLRFSFYVLCGILLFSSVSRAQENFPVPADSVTIQRYLQAVTEAHPSLRAAAFEQEIADAEIRNALGGFDPQLKGKYEYKTKGGKEKVNFVDAGLELPLETLFGPRINAGYTQGEGYGINPESITGQGGEYSVGLTMQLFQGIFTDRRRAALDKARIRPELSTANIDFERNILLRSAALKYWDWTEAYLQAKISEQVLNIARDRANALARRARAGEIAPVDTIEALQEVERRRGEYLRSLRNYEQAGIESAAFIWTGNSVQQALPASAAPSGAQLYALDPGKIARDKEFAVKMRPELRRIDISARLTEIDIALNAESMRPNVEMQALGIYSPALPVLQDYKLGLNVSQPLLFRSAGALQDLSKIALERIRLQRAVAERNTLVEIDNAVLSANRALERIQAAERETGLAKSMLEAEQKRFAAGEGTLLFVNLRERAYAEAQSRLAAAQADYMRAVTQYNFATARISPENW